MFSSYRRTLAIAALTVSIPLSIFVACGSSTFTSDDQDASTVSPQNDSGAGDSQTTTDADAAAVVDAATPTWCQTNAPNAFFCADFDEGDITKAYDRGVLKTMFGPPDIHDAGVPGIFLGEGDAGKSLPGALGVFLPPLANPAPYEWARQQTAYENATGATGFQVDFDLRNDMSSPTSLNGGTFSFEITDPTYLDTYLRCELSVSMTNVNFSGIGTVNQNVGPLPTLGVWTHYRLLVPLAGDVTIQIDDGGVTDVGASGVRPSTTNSQLTLGQECDLFATGTFCNEGLSFDNVVVHAFGTGDGG